MADKARAVTVKVVLLTEIITPRIKSLDLIHSYYVGRPPFPVIDVEDPEHEKPRVAVGFVKDMSKKRSAFLFGEDRFPGPAGIEFEDDAFREVVQQVWDANRLEGKLLSLGVDLYNNGYAAWKVIMQPTNERRPIRIDRIKPRTLFVEFGAGEDHTKDNVVAWVVMYQRPDETWYREELYVDKILYYDGVPANPDEVQTFLHVAPEDADMAAVKFTLVEEIKHSLGVIPVVFAAREAEESIWGTPLPEGILTRVDRVNELYTNAMFATAKIADPVLWLKGVKDTSQLSKDADSVWFLESPEAALGILTWEGVPESTLTLIKQLSSQIFTESDIPPILIDPERSIADIPSRSLKILYTDLEGAVQQDRSIISDMFYDMFEIIFNALSTTKGFAGKVKDYGSSFNFDRINWGTIIPVDEKSEQEGVIALFNAGLVDMLHSIMALGYSKEEAEAMMASIKKDAEERMGTSPDFLMDAEDDDDDDETKPPTSNKDTDDIENEDG